MRTEVFNDPASAVPRLERIAESGEVVQTCLESIPFTIGRNSECELHIDSPKVSRRHAVIDREGQQYRIRDLGSTNGTQVNGQGIEQAELNDGDIVIIADLEFTFVDDSAANRLDAATMAIGTRTDVPGADETHHSLIRDIRRIQDMLTHRGVRCHVNSVIDLSTNHHFGFQATHPFQEDASRASKAVQALLEADSRIAEQLCYLNRLIVAEESLQYRERTHLFLRIHQSEIGGHLLAESMESLAEILAGRHQLVIAVPASAVGPTTYFTEFRQRLTELGALIAYDRFEGGQLDQWSDNPPDFVQLVPSLTQGVGKEPERRRVLTWLLDAAAELKARLVATGLLNEDDVQACRELGYPLGEGPIFGSQPISTSFRNVQSAPCAELVTTG